MITISKRWWDMATKYGKENGSFIEIRPGNEQWNAWNLYFYHLDWWPYTFGKLGWHKSKSWTAPCEWPQHLPKFEWQIKSPSGDPPPREPPKAQRETIDQLRARLGPHFGLNPLENQETPDARLVRLYPYPPKPIAAADVPATPQLSNLMKAFLAQDPTK